MKRIPTFLAGLLITFTGAAQAKPHAPVSLVYQQTSSLTAGQPVDIVVTLKPSSEIDHMDVQFRGSTGLNILSGQSLGTAAAGTPVEHHLTISAAADGRYYLSAVIRTSGDSGVLARVVAIPVTIGNASGVQTHAMTTIDATGERIQSLPAQATAK